jgi:outer membrane protein assembly factor BamB
MSKAWMATTAAMLTITLVLGAAHGAENWLQWRGPDRNGIVSTPLFNPATIEAGPKTRWTAEVGKGYSAVAVAGPYVYTMGNIDEQDIIYCLREDDGKEVWRHTYPCKGASYPGPRATPCYIDGQVPMLFTISREGHIFALNAETGDIIWQRNAVDEFGAGIPRWGIAGSPVVEDGVLLLNVASYGVALDAKTGKTLWKSPAAIGGYSTPVVAMIGGVKTVVVFGEMDVFGVDFKTGQKRFSHPWETKYHINAADPVVKGNRVFISSGYDRGCALLDVSRKKPTVIWENKALKNHFSTSILQGDYLYGVDGNTGRGKLACINMTTGKTAWTEDLAFGSAIAVDETLIYFNERGNLFISEMTPAGYTQVASASQLLPRTCWTPPVLCRGALYLRNEKGRLISLDVK